MIAARSTISFTEENWTAVAKEKNKSKLVNKALELYLGTKKLLKQKEEEFLLNELAHLESTGETYSFEETFR
jgi:hypothetical protein